MPKFFVVSDIHGYYDELRSALDEAHFSAEDPDHWLVSCGDHFDRGDKPMEVMEFLQSLPRKVLIRGNHEDLFDALCEREYTKQHDYSNGTFKTILDLSPVCAEPHRAYREAKTRTNSFFDSMVNYFETEKYVYVHGFIPVQCNDDCPLHWQNQREFSKHPDWRHAHESEWEQARWLNSIKMVHSGFGIDKTIVAGHWHCSYGHAISDGTPEFGEGSDFSPYYTDGLIAIDACTAYTKKVNVVVLEDEFVR